MSRWVKNECRLFGLTWNPIWHQALKQQQLNSAVISRDDFAVADSKSWKGRKFSLKNFFHDLYSHSPLTMVSLFCQVLITDIFAYESFTEFLTAVRLWRSLESLFWSRWRWFIRIFKKFCTILVYLIDKLVWWTLTSNWYPTNFDLIGLTFLNRFG